MNPTSLKSPPPPPTLATAQRDMTRAFSMYSTLSGGFNAIAAVVLEDFVKPGHRWRTRKELEDKHAALISKVLGIL